MNQYEFKNVLSFLYADLLKDCYILLQTPDLHDIPSSHSPLSPHLHVPESQVSDVILEHIGLIPHVHRSEVQVSDNPVQS